MENNLEDILVDNIEEKPSSKSKARLIIITVATIVLLAVLGTLAYVLLKSEPKKNPEFNHTELEKIIPEESQPDDFDKLIAEIKNKDTLNQPQTSISAEELRQNPVQKTPQVEEKPTAPKSEDQPQIKQNVKEESKPKKENKPKAIENKPIVPKVQESKQQENKKEIQKKSQVEKKAPSASKAFESLETPMPPKGYYLQIGVFGGKPQAAFISKLASFEYKTETLQKGGKVLTRYLVGPYINKDQAEAAIFNVMQTMGIKPIIIEIK
ncbi:hypothetical protein CQA62_03600 [Helicobacter cholecystus]|uniref:SPOR domain-containing protein n=1 Tax=Helicobacter cholecystus TaxID=45498 RepID=A0A3D8IVD7_9HELI|nr:SPOR domain-containing protein [Helicobacter cholecystus]RDU69237.1 hypothetical protein CQA62_03600 [Helicobacter cholecystus]VEJ24312.1 sporulation related domain protein [Helicobacter cholecystus]